MIGAASVHAMMDHVAAALAAAGDEELIGELLNQRLARGSGATVQRTLWGRTGREGLVGALGPGEGPPRRRAPRGPPACGGVGWAPRARGRPRAGGPHPPPPGRLSGRGAL